MSENLEKIRPALVALEVGESTIPLRSNEQYRNQIRFI